MTIPKINSSHGAETRNIINRVIEVLNQQGKSLQDLVAEGQLTEEQYAELLTTINGLVKSGNVDKSDLTPEFKGEIEGFDAQLAQTMKVINVSEFIVNGTSDDSQAIIDAINGVPPNGTLIFDFIGRNYLVGDETTSFTINKPMKIVGTKGTWIKVKDQSNLFHNGVNTPLIRVVSSDVSFDGVNIDGNSRNNFIVDGSGNNVYYGSGAGGSNLIQFIAGEQDGETTITDVSVMNCHLIDSTMGMVSANGGLGVNDTFDDTTVQGIDRIHLINNTVSGGQASILNFVGGVKNGIMQGNIGHNAYYHTCRVYFHTLNCSIIGNTIFTDSNLIDQSKFRTHDFPIGRQGIRVGHSDRAVGTCKNTNVIGNIIKATGDLGDSEGISVMRDVTNCLVSNNFIDAPGLLLGIRLFGVGNDVVVSNNTIKNIGVDGIEVMGGDGTPKDISITNNFISASNSRLGGGTVANIHINDGINGVYIANNHLVRQGLDRPHRNIRFRADTENNKFIFNQMEPFDGDMNAQVRDDSDGKNIIQGTFNEAVFIGNNTPTLFGSTQVSIGHNVNAGAAAVAVGKDTEAAVAGVALGIRATANADSAVAIGRDATASFSRSVAIGRNAAPTEDNEIALGSNNAKVKVRGTLELTSNGGGTIVRSPNGTRYQIGVNNTGEIVATAL